MFNWRWLAFWLIIGSGCSASPDYLRPADLDTSAKISRHADSTWSRQGPTSLHRSAGKTIAVVEFSVEFVTERIETAPQSGVRNRRTDFAEGLKAELPGALYLGFVEQLTDLGHTVLHTTTINRSVAFGRCRGSAIGQAAPTIRLQMPDSDLGRPKLLQRYPIDGLVCIDVDQTKMEQTEIELLRELDADIAIRAHIRIGVHQGRATIERGSVIGLTTRHEITTLVSERSAMSDEQVAALHGQTYAVNTIALRKAVDQLWGGYLEMALRR